MNSELLNEIVDMIETQVRSQPTAFEFEMAYQARVAIDRIRFAIKLTEQFVHNPQQLKEVGLHLLDALDRLQSADHRFQQRFRPKPGSGDPRKDIAGSNGSKTGSAEF